MLNGYIKMHRKFAEWEWYKEPCTKDVFIHLLIMASFKGSSWKGVELKPGQVIVGRKALAEAIGWSEQNVRTALKHLEKTQEITIKPTNKYSIVTIEKWGKYQLDCDEDNQQSNQQLTSNQPTTNQQLTTSKECKEYKNVKNDKKTIYAQVPLELVEPLKAFEEHRKKLKAPLTDHALELLVKKVRNLANGNTQVMVDILNQSIEQGWKGVFELSKPKKPRNEVLAILESGVLDD